jgi:hypothetical protein
MSPFVKKSRYKYWGMGLPPMYLIISLLQKRFLFQWAPQVFYIFRIYAADFQCFTYTFTLFSTLTNNYYNTLQTKYDLHWIIIM